MQAGTMTDSLLWPCPKLQGEEVARSGSKPRSAGSNAQSGHTLLAAPSTLPFPSPANCTQVSHRVVFAAISFLVQSLVPIANTLNGGKRECDVASEIQEWQAGNPSAWLGL